MIIVRQVRLPYAVRGVTSPNPDGTYTIFLNSRLSPEQQREVFAHEVAHIERDHFSANLSLEDAELEASRADFPQSASEPEAIDNPFFFARGTKPRQGLSPPQLRRLAGILSALSPDICGGS